MSERCEEKCGAYFLVTTFFFTEPKYFPMIYSKIMNKKQEQFSKKKDQKPSKRIGIAKEEMKDKDVSLEQINSILIDGFDL